ncbi:hypothetical protein [Rhodococcus sp. SJ-3]|uniref:hypothetical protein n=1 Tax=Rhodococcus sp. SJ-3 TaxID=3454628 RepID=UPI003F7A040D
MILAQSIETATAMSAWAMVATAVIAFLAGCIALWQVREARKARALQKRLAYEQARPYVSVFMEPSQATEQFIDLVIKNFGLTGASNIHVRVTPSLKQSAQPKKDLPEQDVVLPAKIHHLGPGQEWRVFWDSSFARKNSNLPNGHVVHVAYNSSEGRLHCESFYLDWSIYKGRTWTNVLSVHDVAQRLLTINNTLEKFSSLTKRTLDVRVTDVGVQTLVEVATANAEVDEALKNLGTETNKGE